MKKFMKRTVVTITIIYLLAITILLAGCGGGGGATDATNSTGTPAAKSQAVLYLTDSFREDFAHVWSTIYHVDLIPQSGAPVALFDNPNGVQIDLKTLRDSTGERFSFLGAAAIPQGTYSGIEVTIGASMQLFRSGAAVGNPLPVDSSIPTDATGHPILDLTFSVPKTFASGTHTVIVDFDLARFIVRDSKVLPLIQEGNPNRSGDPSRHNDDDYRGTVSNLSGTAPDLTFTIADGNGRTTKVVTNASTAVSGTSTLADGSIVMVTGTVDTATGNLVANRLKVLPLNPLLDHSFGAVASQDPANGTLTITIRRAHGFTPTQTTLKIVTDGATAFFDDDGAKLTANEFFTNLAAASAPSVLAEGSFDATTNTLTATEVEIVDTSIPVSWANNPHLFRPGTTIANWGHGIIR